MMQDAGAVRALDATFAHVVRGALARFVVATALLVALTLSALAETTERRIALVVGNSEYRHVSGLANPERDGTAMAERLEGLGFDVHRGLDLDLAGLRLLVDRFTRAAEDADTVLVYYSGHAFQLRGLNYLVPVDAALETKAAIATETMRLDTLLGDLEGEGRQVLAFLDACRNNPLPPARRTGDGLAQVETGKGVFVAFATSPGNVSYDGRGQHSPFTQALLDHMGTGGQSVSDMMIAVRNTVEAQTLHQQTPWDQSSLRRQVYLADPGAVPPVAAAALAPARTDAILSTPRTLGLRDDASAPGDPDKGIADTTGPADGTVELASLGPRPGLDVGAEPDNAEPDNAEPDGAEAGAAVGSEDDVVIVPDILPGVLEGEDLVFAVQEELKRVGCYRSTVDGIWGKGSRGAAVQYLESKKVSASAAEPTEFLLDALKGETGEVCAPPPPPRRVAPSRPREPAATVRRSGSKSSTTTRRASAPRSTPRTTAKRSAPARRTAAPAAPKQSKLAGAKLTGGLR